MRMIVEQLVEWRLAEETEALGENLPQRHFVHHKSHIAWPELEVGPRLAAWAMARPCKTIKQTLPCLHWPHFVTRRPSHSEL
jgi:hypothetical protein